MKRMKITQAKSLLPSKQFSLIFRFEGGCSFVKHCVLALWPTSSRESLNFHDNKAATSILTFSQSLASSSFSFFNHQLKGTYLQEHHSSAAARGNATAAEACL